MNLVITGGCGFIGRNLLHFLRTEHPDWKVRILDSFRTVALQDFAKLFSCRVIDAGSSGIAWPENGDVIDIVRVDVRDRDTVAAALIGADNVVHLAASTGVPDSVADPIEDFSINVMGTLHCLEAARMQGIKRFVFASSGAPIGMCTPPIHEEVATHPVSPYGASKLAGEGYCSAYSGSFSLSTAVLRFGNVYGPHSGHKKSVVAEFIRKTLQGEDLSVYGTGTQTRDYIYAGDLVEAICLALVHPDIHHEIFQIATNRETTVNELIEVFGNVLADEGISVPRIVNEAPRTGDVERNFSDTSKAARILGWKAKTGLEEGLRSTLAWYRQNDW